MTDCTKDSRPLHPSPSRAIESLPSKTAGCHPENPRSQRISHSPEGSIVGTALAPFASDGTGSEAIGGTAGVACPPHAETTTSAHAPWNLINGSIAPPEAPGNRLPGVPGPRVCAPFPRRPISRILRPSTRLLLAGANHEPQRRNLGPSPPSPRGRRDARSRRRHPLLPRGPPARLRRHGPLHARDRPRRQLPRLHPDGQVHPVPPSPARRRHVKEPSHDHVLRAAATGDDAALAELVRAY